MLLGFGLRQCENTLSFPGLHAETIQTAMGAYRSDMDQTADSLSRRWALGLSLVFCFTTFSPADVPAAGGPRSPEEPRVPDVRFEALVGELTEHLKRVDPRTETLPKVDFPAGKDWVNSPRLSLHRELRGKITILDFWTYCCINCIHILPDLAALEAKYAGFPVATWFFQIFMRRREISY